MAFEKLLNPDGTNFIPAESDLAWHSPGPVYHRLEPAIEAQITYWRRQENLARAKVEGGDWAEIGRLDVATRIRDWLTLGLDEQQGAPNLVAIQAEYGLPDEAMEFNRKTVLGGLAMSMAVRAKIAIDPDQIIVDGPSFGYAANVIPDLTFSVESPDQPWLRRPLPPRLHVVMDEGLELPADISWYRHGRILLERSAPGEVNPPLAENLASRSILPDAERLVTFTPYITSIDSPLNQ